MKSTVQILHNNEQNKQKSKKKVNLTFTLPDPLSINAIEVCRTFFKHTLGIRWNNFITKFVHTQLENPLSTPQESREGDTTQESKQTREQIINHINSFHPQLSHYKTEHAPNKRFLNPELSIRYLWRDFLENQELPKVSYSNYQKVLKSQNIGFARLSQDECDLCLEFREHQKIHEHDEGAQECSVCAAAKQLHNMAESARREYQTDKSKSETNKSHPEEKSR